MAIQERNSEMVNLLSVDFISKTDTAYLVGIVTGAILALPGLIAFWPMQVSVGDSNDIYPDYAYLPGRAGGQHLRGGTASGDDLTLESTSHATKGDVTVQPNGGIIRLFGFTYVGNESVDYAPTAINWATTGSNIVLAGLSNSVLGFYDVNSTRVDFIRVGDQVITIGYDGGFGSAYTYLPGGGLVARGANANGSLAILGTAEDSHFNFSTDEHTYLRGGKTTSNVYVGDVNDGIITLGSGNGRVLPQGELGEDWIALSYVSGWGDFAGGFQTGRYKKIADLVLLDGLVIRTSGVSTIIATLPTGYRPPATVVFAGASNSAFAEIRVSSTGNINLTVGSPTVYVSLSGIIFSTVT